MRVACTGSRSRDRKKRSKKLFKLIVSGARMHIVTTRYRNIGMLIGFHLVQRQCSAASQHSHAVSLVQPMMVQHFYHISSSHSMIAIETTSQACVSILLKSDKWPPCNQCSIKLHKKCKQPCKNYSTAIYSITRLHFILSFEFTLSHCIILYFNFFYLVLLIKYMTS